MKTLVKLVPVCLLLLCISCGKIEDKQVTIAYGPAKKTVRLGDYYWVKRDDGKAVMAANSKMEEAGFILQDENPTDFQTVLEFLNSKH